MSFIDFFISPHFIPLLITSLLNIVFIPFGIIGFRSVWRWFDKNYLKPGKGYMTIRMKRPNDRIWETMLRPTGEMVKFKPFGKGDEVELPFKNEKGWVAFDGNIPIIEFDSNLQQKSFESNEKSEVSQEEITRGYKVSYETGKLVGAMDFMKDLKFWLILILIVSVIGAIVNIGGIMMNRSSMAKLEKAITANSPSQIADATVGLWLNRTGYNPATGGSIPRVG